MLQVAVKKSQRIRKHLVAESTRIVIAPQLLQLYSALNDSASVDVIPPLWIALINPPVLFSILSSF
jgi:hypothetical protein